MSQSFKTPKKAVRAKPAAKVVVRVALRSKKPAPLTADGKARLRAAARRPNARLAPELPEWRAK